MKILISNKNLIKLRDCLSQRTWSDKTDGVSKQHTDVCLFFFTSILAEDHVVGYSRPSLITITQKNAFFGRSMASFDKAFLVCGEMGGRYLATRRGDPPVRKPDSRG